jgi:hypothetical protein
MNSQNRVGLCDSLSPTEVRGPRLPLCIAVLAERSGSLHFTVRLRASIAASLLAAASTAGVLVVSTSSASQAGSRSPKMIHVRLNPQTGAAITVTGTPAHVVLDPATGRVLSVTRQR